MRLTWPAAVSLSLIALAWATHGTLTPCGMLKITLHRWIAADVMATPAAAPVALLGKAATIAMIQAGVSAMVADLSSGMCAKALIKFHVAPGKRPRMADLN